MHPVFSCQLVCYWYSQWCSHVITHDCVALQVGSCVLFGLFLCFKYLPKWLVNMLLSGYITLLGAFAINAAALPFVNQLFSEELQHRVSCGTPD